MRVLLGLLKVLMGVSLAIAILFFSGVYAVRYAMTRLLTPPERPVFPEEKTTVTATDSNGDGEDAALPSSEDSTQKPVDFDGTATDNTPQAAADSTEAESDDDTAEDESLEPGAYRARVIQPIGLVLRQGPDISTIQLGGVAYNEEVVVLSESSDGRWLNVRLPGSDVEGWVKNGNTEILDNSQTEQ